MTYGFVIAINLLAWIGWSTPITAFNLAVAAFTAGLWAAECMNNRLARTRHPA